MNIKKHRPFIGILSLVINIILPTLICIYYCQIATSHEEIIACGILAALLLLWIITLIVALRELGGLVLHLVDHNRGKSVLLRN